MYSLSIQKGLKMYSWDVHMYSWDVQIWAGGNILPMLR
jgi:hypothetical protein